MFPAKKLMKFSRACKIVVPKEWSTWQCSTVINSIQKLKHKNAEIHYSNIGREVLGILPGLENMIPILLCPWGHHSNGAQTADSNIQDIYYSTFITQASKNTTSKTPLHLQNTICIRATAIHCTLAVKIQPLNKWRQGNTRHVHQNWHKSCMDIPECMTVKEVRVAFMEDEHLSALEELVLCSWPSMKAEVQKELQLYWSFGNETPITDDNVTKERIFILMSQDKALKQLHVNHMSIDNENAGTWVNILDQHEDQHRKGNQKLSHMSWLSGNRTKGQNNVTRDTRMIMVIYYSWHLYMNNKHYLCIVDYHR